MIEKLKELLADKKVLILGFGREGESTYQVIRSIFPNKNIGIADKETVHENALLIATNDKNIQLNLGKNYLEEINKHDFIFKSPGIKLENFDLKPGVRLSSQTQLFLGIYSGQTIGITGTKGKSTTASLIHHAFVKAGKNTVLVGNIGTPPFSEINKISKHTLIVFELSAHQLEDVTHSPHIAVFLNIFEEHLDHFQNFDHYVKSKCRIFNQAKKDLTLIYNLNQPELLSIIPKQNQASGLGFSLKQDSKAKCFMQQEVMFLNTNKNTSPIFNVSKIKSLIGKHNQNNVMAALLACMQTGLTAKAFYDGLLSFKSLAHRLEFVGEFKKIHFYNDSISTIPEATIEAIKSLPKTDTLILGGHDRGINYVQLIHFLISSKVRNLIFMGPAGKRMKMIFESNKQTNKNILVANSLTEAFEHILKFTQADKICLLSPAASSYDSFKNFEERGDTYKKMARNL